MGGRGIREVGHAGGRGGLFPALSTAGLENHYLIIFLYSKSLAPIQ
jgi:hypothetical protein